VFDFLSYEKKKKKKKRVKTRCPKGSRVGYVDLECNASFATIRINGHESMTIVWDTTGIPHKKLVSLLYSSQDDLEK